MTDHEATIFIDALTLQLTRSSKRTTTGNGVQSTVSAEELLQLSTSISQTDQIIRMGVYEQGEAFLVDQALYWSEALNEVRASASVTLVQDGVV